MISGSVLLRSGVKMRPPEVNRRLSQNRINATRDQDSADRIAVEISDPPVGRTMAAFLAAIAGRRGRIRSSAAFCRKLRPVFRLRQHERMQSPIVRASARSHAMPDNRGDTPRA